MALLSVTITIKCYLCLALAFWKFLKFFFTPHHTNSTGQKVSIGAQGLKPFSLVLYFGLVSYAKMGDSAEMAKSFVLMRQLLPILAGFD